MWFGFFRRFCVLVLSFFRWFVFYFYLFYLEIVRVIFVFFGLVVSVGVVCCREVLGLVVKIIVGLLREIVGRYVRSFFEFVWFCRFVSFECEL